MPNFTVKLSITVISSLMLYYIIKRFSVIFNINISKRVLLIAPIIISIIITLTFMYQWDNQFLDIIGIIGSWLFVLAFILTILLSIENLISIRYKINPRIILWIIVLIFWVWAYFSLHTKITYLDIETDKINKDTKILLVSDIHAEHVTSTYHINKIKRAIETEKPDFTIIAWDLINEPNIRYAKYFKNIKPNHDSLIFAVMWNHDTMWGIFDAIKKVSYESRITFLNNKLATYLNWCVNSDSGNCTWAIQIIWLIDKYLWWNSNLDQNLKDAEVDKLNNRDNFTILVTHQPISLEKLQNYPIDLEVAWHTHRGQFYWMRKVVQRMNEYTYWEYRLWDKIAFITQGIWTWWLPFRLWTQSEIVIINLKKK